MRKRKEILRLSEEDRAFMEALYESHKKTFYYTAYRVCQDPQLAKDIIQDCLINLSKNIFTLRQLDCCKIDAYIVVSIRRLMINHTKRDKAILFLPIDRPMIQDAVDEISNAIAREKEDTRLDLEILLAQLSERDRLILESKYILGLDEEEIAAAVGCKPNSVRTLISRARERARAIGLKSEKGDDSKDG